MGAGPLVVELLLSFLLTVFLLNKYGNWRRQHPLVTASTLIGWFFSFIIIFVLPLDVAITFYNRCVTRFERSLNASSSSTASPISNVSCEEPPGLVADEVLLSLWRLVYWSAQVLTWIVLPLLQSYVQAGDFTAVGRFQTAIRQNAIYYGAYLLVFVILLIYAVFKGVVLNAEHLKVIVVSASNTWGLLLLVGLLGYGLVEVPRQMWSMGTRDYRLNRTYFDIDKLASDKSEAEDALKDVYKEARAVLNVLKNEHGAREWAQIVVSTFPEELVAPLFISRNATDFASLTPSDMNVVSSEKYLISLHQRAICAVQNLQRVEAQWRSLISRALLLEEVAQAELSGRFDHDPQYVLPPKARFIWHVVLKRPLCKAVGVLLCAATVLIVVSECTFFIITPTLSPAALLLQYEAEHFHYKYTQFVAVALITYLCTCAYFTIFRLKIYKYYHLDPNGYTDENSLLFSAILLCRLTPPICLNLLGMIHLDSHISQQKDYGVEPQFTRLMGHLDLLPILAKGINIYLPMLILIFCTLTYFRLGTRLLHAAGFDQFVDQDDFTQEMVTAGRSLVALERNRRNREHERQRRDHGWSAKISGIQGRIRNLRGTDQDDLEPMVTAEERDESFHDALRSSPLREHPPPNMFDDL